MTILTVSPGRPASSEFWMASRITASGRLPRTSVEKNSPSMGSTLISPRDMGRNFQSG